MARQPRVEVLDSGRMDSRDSAYPSAVQLPSGEILCCFGVGGGPHIHGCTDLARSSDGGKTWRLETTILPASSQPYATNALKLSLSPDHKILYAYGVRSYRAPEMRFGEGRAEAVICRSLDHGRTWSPPQVVPMPEDCPLEISYAALVLDNGRLLAPAATLPSQQRLGEKVYLAVSDDQGRTWPRHVVAFRDPADRCGYFEHKFAQIAPGRVMGVCWTVTFGQVLDQPNSFVISNDRGQTWSPPRSTGIMGQTMTPVPLGGDRLLVLYNRRYGRQGVVMALVTFTDESWQVHYEDLLYDPGANRQRPTNLSSGVDEFDSFQFGFPTAIVLRDGHILATHWCMEAGHFGIRWTRLRLHW